MTMATPKPGDKVTYFRHFGGEATGILLDRAPEANHWWVHTEDPNIFDKVWDKGRMVFRGSWTASGRPLLVVP
jgi:hypothetical protein